MKYFGWWLCVVMCLMTAGCADDKSSSPEGEWLEEAAIQKTIEAGTLFPDHTYYYMGSITAPDSFIAIDNHWQLRTRVWAEVAMSPQRLAGWLQWYRSEHYGICDYRGGRILAPDGSLVGYWYSQNPINNVYMPEPGVIEVYKPHSVGGQVCGESNIDSFFPGGD